MQERAQSRFLQERYLVVGLGNPGAEYSMTRHNLGFLVLQTLAGIKQLTWQRDKHTNGLSCKSVLNGVAIDLLLPETYMNLSGGAIKAYLDYYKMGIAQLIVICDDLSLPFGHLRLRSGGASGGHNGLKSIIKVLGSQEFTRLRMGIGQPTIEGQSTADYVLGVFNLKEKEGLPLFIKEAIQVLQTLTTEPVSIVMNRLNRKLTRPIDRSGE